MDWVNLVGLSLSRRDLPCFFKVGCKMEWNVTYRVKCHKTKCHLGSVADLQVPSSGKHIDAKKMISLGLYLPTSL